MSHDPTHAGSGPGGPLPVTPPGSTPCRELLHAIRAALDVPPARAEHDERQRCSVLSARARLARESLARVLRPGAGDDLDMLTEARVLRDRLADYPPDYSTGPAGPLEYWP